MKKFYVAHAEAIAMGMFAPDVALNMYGPFNTKDEAEKEVKKYKSHIDGSACCMIIESEGEVNYEHRWCERD